MDDAHLGETLLHLALAMDSARHAYWRGTPAHDLLQRDTQVYQHLAQERPRGMELMIDLYHCDPARLRDPQHLHAFVTALTALLSRYQPGESLITRTGPHAQRRGSTLVQWHDTATIAAHVLEQEQVGCLTIFSWEAIPPYAIARLCQHWLGAREVEVAITFRGARHQPTEKGRLTP